MPIIHHGGGGERDRSRVRLPALRGPAVRPRDAGVPAGLRRPAARRRGRRLGAGEHRVRARAESRRPTRSASLISTRLPELVLIEVLRAHLAVRAGRRPRLARRAARPGARAGAGAAARRARPQVDGRRARRRARRCRARCSTSASARCSAARRSATSPSGACTWPRSCSPPPTSASRPIARRVGYDSEEAFSRAFKRARGLSPSHWRAARSRRPA